MWTVTIHAKARKALGTLPEPARLAFARLVLELEANGPVAGRWPNYGKLGKYQHHCHLKKGKPTYVSVWWEIQEETQLIEVTYVGTHEKAPY